MNVSKKSKSFLFALIGLVVVGIPLTVYLVQHQQLFQQFAWSTQQSAVSQCSSQEGSAVINVTFANTESSKDINVTANDLQTGTIVDLGTVKHQEVKSASIVTGKSALINGSVLFKMTWADNSPGTDQLAATYKAISNCPVTPPTNFCTADGQNNQGFCEWDALAGAEGYTVVVKNSDTNTVIQSLSVAKDATQSAFPMTPGTAYQCTVTPTNVCGNGTATTSPTKTCTIPSPSVSPTPPVCQNGTSAEGICQWDAMSGADMYTINVKDVTTGQTVASTQSATTTFSFPDNGTDTYECSVSAANTCGETSPSKSPQSTCIQPTPTVTTTPVPSGTSTPTPTTTTTPTVAPTATPIPPTPTATPIPPTPTDTPTPTVKPTPIPTATPVPPTPTPIVIVRTINQPPQQTIIRTTVQTPGQTQTIVQQGAQTVVQQQQPPAKQTIVTTPIPTVMPTGDTTPTYFIFGISATLLLAGGLIFFIL